MTVLGVIAAVWAMATAGALALCRIGQPSRSSKPEPPRPTLRLVSDDDALGQMERGRSLILN